MDAASIDKFLRERYYIELLKAAREEGPLIVDFNDLDRFNPILADQLLEIPEKIIDEFNKAATKIAEHGIIVRIKNIPERRNIRIRNLRAKHLNKLLCIDAIIKSASEVRPQIYEAVFECPECSAKLVVPQETNLMQKPYVCGDPFVKGGCGRRGDFNQIEKKMMDTRWLFGVEPFELTTGEHPGEISIFLKDDLTTPKMQKKTDPGNKITIVGILKELPKRIKGKLSTKMDMYVEANYLAPSEIDFEELEISQEDEINIREMAADPNIYEKLKASIAPGIYGFDEIKEAIVLQLFGGIPHVLPDGNRIRGNIHILLTGDPGVGKSVTGSMRILHNSDDSVEYESIGNMIDRTLVTQKGINHGDAEICANARGVKVMTLNPKTQYVEWKPVSLFIRHKSPETLVKIKTKSGREITATRNHSFVVMGEDGNITTVEGNKSKGSFVPVPLNSHRELISEIALPQEIRTNAKALPEKIKLDWNFGFFLGLFIAEGSVNNKGNIFIYSKNSERKDKISSFLKSVGMNAKIDEERILTSSKNMVRFLENNCYKGEKITTGKGSGASRKCLPSFCFFAPKEFIYGLLSGLFSGDGYFVNSKPCAGRKKGNLKIGFTSISEELAYGLLEILSLVGMFATIRKRNYIYNSKEKKCYEILVRWDYATDFMERIAMIGKKPSIPRISEKDAIDSLPCTGLLYSIVKELGYSKRLIKDAAARRSFAAMMRTVRNRGFIGRRRMKRVYELLLSESEAKNNALVMKKLERLKSILESNVVWDRIIKTEEMPSNEKYVYDLSVEGNENFTVNNVIVHNTMFLKLVSSVVPRGRYVSGSGVSGAGLTATVVKNEAIGGWVLEAGALILCNKGLIAIDEFDKMSKDDQIAMHEATSVESYHGNTPITLANGEIRNIRYFVDSIFEQNKDKIVHGNDCYFINVEGPEILTTDFNKISPKKIIRVSKHKAPDIFYKITLQNGRSITVTPNHPCFVFDGRQIIEKAVDKLSEGEFVPIPSLMPITGKEQLFSFKTKESDRYNTKPIKVPLHNSHDLCKFIGYLISEGSHEINRGKVSGISFTNSNEKLLKDFENTTKHLFGLKPYVQKKPGRTMLRYISMKLKNLVHEIEPSLLENASKKRIPPFIFKCRNEEIAFMLRAMFDGDGSVYGRKNSLYITYSTASEVLANQLHELLLRFSIISYIRSSEPRGRTKQIMYNVVITGSENLKSFVGKIGFSEPEKNEKILGFIKAKMYRAPYSEKLPVGKLMIDLIKRAHLSQKDVFGCTIEYNNYNLSKKMLQRASVAIEKHVQRVKECKGKINASNIQDLRCIRTELKISTNEIAGLLGVRHQMVSYIELRNIEKYLASYQSALLKVIDKILENENDIQRLHSLAFGDIAFCRIKEIKKIENKTEKWSYDMTVHGGVFISNGMVLHNTVSIAKASIVATLPAQTAVLAGANPKLGRFDSYQSIAEQINIPETLLSRFDLKFALRDKPDKAADERLAEHVILSRTTPELVEPLIRTALLRKYIAYAKQINYMELLPETGEMLKNFYVDMRNQYSGEDVQTVSITLRQYEALLRMAEASAKIRLDKKIRIEDAERAVRLMKYSLMQLGMDTETGRIDIDKMESGITATKRRKIGIIMDILESMQKGSKDVSVSDIKAEAESQGVENVEDILDKLKRDGMVFEPKPGFLKKV